MKMKAQIDNNGENGEEEDIMVESEREGEKRRVK